MQTITAPKTAAPRRTLLRTALQLDAGVTAVNGAAYLALAGPLHDLLGFSEGAARRRRLPPRLRRGRRRARRRRGPRAAPSSPSSPATRSGRSTASSPRSRGWGDPTTAGTVWIVLQALVVAGFAGLQLAGLKRAER